MRNGAGTFAVLNPILVGALRSSAHVNADFVDMGNEITNTLPLDGQAGMSGPFKAASGTLAFPGMGFASDRNLGFRRSAGDTMAWVAAAVDRFYIDEDGKGWFTGAVDVSAAVSFSGALTGSVDLPAIEALGSAAPTVGLARRTAANTWALDDGTYAIMVTRDGRGMGLAAGHFADVRFPFAATLTSVTLLADQTGSAVVDIWKAAYASYPPVDAGSITGSTPPTLSAAKTYEDTALAGWTTAIAAGDCLRFNLDSSSTVTAVQVALKYKRFI